MAYLHSKSGIKTLSFGISMVDAPVLYGVFTLMIGGKFAPLTIMSNDDTDIDSMITTFNTAVTETALANIVRRKNPG